MSQPRKSFLLRLSPEIVHPIIPTLAIFLIVNAITALIFYLEEIPFVVVNFEGGLIFGTAYGYLIFVTRLINAVHLKDFHTLRLNAQLSVEENETWVNKMVNHRSQLIETLVAVGVGLLHSYLQGSGRILTGDSTYLIYDIWRVILTIFIWVMITQSTSLFIRNMTLLNELSRQVKIDLLNMEKFMPLTRSGVWSILGFIGVYSILFARGIDNISFNDPAILVLVPSIIWMIRTPLKGLRSRVIKAKDKELELIDQAIEGDREALKNTRIRKNLENINVIDLINYKRMIQNTFEIPVNIPTASRFLFYLIIPLLTWIAASMVDKVIDYLIK